MPWSISSSSRFCPFRPGQLNSFVVRSPFRAKHYVAVQYMARWMKCPLPPPLPLPQLHSPLPDPPSPARPPSSTGPPPPCWTRRTRKNRRHYRQGTSHCSCLEHCFLFLFLFCETGVDTRKFIRHKLVPQVLSGNKSPWVIYSSHKVQVFCRALCPFVDCVFFIQIL